MTVTGRWINCGCANGIDAYASEYNLAFGSGVIVECGRCWGDGRLWRYESGRLALYPGGPFAGSEPQRVAT